MIKRPKKVIVVGGGIMGASVAWHLARGGAAVTVIERQPIGNHNVTASSFGWVGASASTPSDDPRAFAERLNALSEFSRLERDLGSLPIAARGALLWGSDEDETMSMINEHQVAGTRIESLTLDQLLEKEPMLISPPPLVAWAPDDFAVEPAALAHQLLTSAQDAGAEIRSGSVQTIETKAGRVIGVTLENEKLFADVVVIANGTEAHQLSLTVGVELPVYESPAVLVRFEAERGLVRHIICAQDLEIRPTQESGLLSALDYPVEGQSALPALARQTAVAISDMLNLPTPLSSFSITVANRPMTTDGNPICGNIGNIEGLYALVAHPGVILAPYLGRLCADSILNF